MTVRCECVLCVLRLGTKWITRDSLAAILWIDNRQKVWRTRVFCSDFATVFCSYLCFTFTLRRCTICRVHAHHPNTLCVSLSLVARKENNTHFYCIKWYIIWNKSKYDEFNCFTFAIINLMEMICVSGWKTFYFGFWCGWCGMAYCVNACAWSSDADAKLRHSSYLLHFRS